MSVKVKKIDLLTTGVPPKPETPVENRDSGRLRTCCRCGESFQSTLNWIVCANCRTDVVPVSSRPLSQREKQIIRLVKIGRTNKDIASELRLSEGTVKEYMNRIFRKILVTNRTELAAWAFGNPDKLE